MRRFHRPSVPASPGALFDRLAAGLPDPAPAAALRFDHARVGELRRRARDRVLAVDPAAVADRLVQRLRALATARRASQPDAG